MAKLSYQRALKTLTSYLDIAQQELRNLKTTYHQDVHDNGNVGQTLSIDWSNGNFQKATVDQSFVLEMGENPAGPTNVGLYLTQSATGGFTASFPATTVLQFHEGGTPSISTGSNETSYIGMVWDGTKYRGSIWREAAP